MVYAMYLLEYQVLCLGTSYVYSGMDVDTEHILQQHNDNSSPTGIKIFSGQQHYGGVI